MLITNNLNLPQPLVAAVANDPYDDAGSDISVTRLIAPPRQVALMKGHGGEVTEDVADLMYAVIGQSVHTILERIPDHSSIVMKERRLFMEMLGWNVSGQVDLVRWNEDGECVLSDWKVMSVWEGMNGLKPDKEAQLNLLALLCTANGIRIDKLEITGIYRDWSKSKARFGQHPPRQVEVFPVPLWPTPDVDDYLHDRVAAHQAAQAGDLPECTAEDRWERPTKYALMKEGRKSALRVTETMDDLHEWAVWKGVKAEADDEWPKGHSVEVRPGECVRCADYCAVADFCDQWASIRETME